MSQLDKQNTGYVNEKNFITNIYASCSDYQLKQLLRFELIPNEVLDEANMQASLAGSMINMRNDKVKSQMYIHSWLNN
jgi:hypothetical protein